MKLEFSRRNFQNTLKYQNLSNGSRNVSCGQTDMTKLIVAFRNFVKAPNSYSECQRLPPTIYVFPPPNGESIDCPEQNKCILPVTPVTLMISVLDPYSR